MAVDIDSNWLTKLGVQASEKEMETFVDLARSELELRVGSEIAEHLSDKQIAEFESLLDADDDDAQLDWLEQAMPNYQAIVTKKYEEMGREIKNSDDKVRLIQSWES